MPLANGATGKIHDVLIAHDGLPPRPSSHCPPESFLAPILILILLNLPKKAYHATPPWEFGRIFTHGTENNMYYLPCETL